MNKTCFHHNHKPSGLSVCGCCVMRCVSEPQSQNHPLYHKSTYRTLPPLSHHSGSWEAIASDRCWLLLYGHWWKALMKERMAREVFICLTVWWQKGRQREVVPGEQGGGGERGEQAHLYVWLPSAKRSATPALINSEKRSQSFFLPHSGAHGLAMTFTSFETKSGSRYSTLQWADMLRCCNPAWRPRGRKRDWKKRSRHLFHSLKSLLCPFTLYLMTLSVEKVTIKPVSAKSQRTWGKKDPCSWSMWQNPQMAWVRQIRWVCFVRVQSLFLRF